MNGTPRPLGALGIVALAVAALMSAGCSTAPAGTGTAGGGTGSGGSGNADHQQAVQFAQCMRDNGVREFPDPDAQGTFTIETIANGTSIDTDSAAFQRAITTCKDLEPPGFTGFARTPEQQQAALKFAQCMRDNGVKDFPDPAITDPLVDTNRIPSANRPGGMTILHAVGDKCDDYAAAAGVTGP